MNLLPFLVVDKTGIIGEALCQNLVLRSLVVCVSKKKPNTDGLENIVFVPHLRTLPIIPDNTYSYMFVVSDCSTTTGFLSSFIKKATRDKSQLLFIVSLFNFASFYKSYKKTKAKSDLAKDQGTVKIAIFGDIFDKNIYPSFIDSAIKFGRIEIEGDGLSKTYPVSLEDVISGVLKVAFGPEVSSSIFYLFPKYPPTQISLARMIQKANPTIKVDFVRSHNRHSGEPEPVEGDSRISFLQSDKVNGKYLLSDNYSLEKRITELKIENLSTANNSNPRPQNRSFPFAWLLLSLFFLAFLPLVNTLAFSFLGFATLGNARTAIEDGNLSDAQKSNNASGLFFNLAQKSSRLLLTQAKLIGQENKLVPITRNLSLGQDLSRVVRYGLDASRILSQVSMDRSINPKEDFTKGTSLLKNATVLLRKNEAEEGVPKDLLAKIKSMDSVIKIVENIIDVLPSLFGFDGKKTYLVLFQNNMELRPGGGFIGSYGLLTIGSGRIEDFSIHDIYDADGQLKEHVNPPFAIRRHLSLAHWYLRDSNFDVDFGRGASSAALLLRKELGKRVDGVIGVDVSFVKSILEAVGPVYVADYKETATSSNLFKLVQSHAEKNFFPGSRQKKDFLKSLFNAMQLNITLRENLPYLSLAKTISESISGKHLLFAFNDKHIQDVFTVNGWSSTLWGLPDGTPLWDAPSGASSTSINDFLGINEANLGVNKANYFVKRNVIHKIKINEDGNIIGELTIDYKNTSNEWPGGDYVNYLRTILPFRASISSVSFDGVSQTLVPAVTDPLIYEAKNFVKPLGLEVERYNQSGKTIYGFLVSVEAGKEKSIEIKYSLSQKIPSDLTAFSYNLAVFKQPGTDNYPYSFSISYPKRLRVIDGSDYFSGQLEGDTDISARFAQN